MAKETRTEPTTLKAHSADSLMAVSVGGKEAVEKLRTFKSFRAEGRALLSGASATFWCCYQAPDKFVIEMSMGEGLVIRQGFDGTLAWNQDMNGAVTELSGFEREQLMAQTYLAGYSYLLPERMAGTTVLAGTYTYHDTAYYRVICVPSFGDTIQMLYDIHDGRLLKSLSRTDQYVVETSNSDFRIVEGIQQSFRSVTTMAGTPVNSEILIEKLDFHASCDSSLFSPPREEAADFVFPAGQKSHMISFKIQRGHIWFEATLNGNAKRCFILDSGASSNVFDSSGIADLSLPTVGNVQGQGIGGFTDVALVEIDTLTIGDLTLFHQVAGRMNLSALSERKPYESRFGGIVGFDFLSRFPVLVDYSDSTLTMYNPDSFTPPDSAVVVPMAFMINVPVIEVTIGEISGPFMVDLGNSFGLILHRPYAEQHGMLDSLIEFKETRMLGGIGGSVAGKSMLAPRVKFASIQIDSLEVILSDGGMGIAGSEEIAGNIGYEILKSFRLLFDYRRKQILFLPAKV